MKIKQVCELTSLTDRAIRYYIEEGLLSPAYTENYMGRRAYDFTEADVAALNHVATLRKFGFTVEEIRRILTDPQESVAIVGDVRARKEETLRQEGTNLDALSRLEEARAYTVAELAEKLAEPVREVEAPKEDRWLNWKKRLLVWLKAAPVWAMALVPLVLSALLHVLILLDVRYPRFHLPMLGRYLGWMLISLGPVLIWLAGWFIWFRCGRRKRIKWIVAVICLVWLPVAFLAQYQIGVKGPFYAQTDDPADYLELRRWETAQTDMVYALFPDQPRTVIHTAVDRTYEAQPVEVEYHYLDFEFVMGLHAFDVYAEWTLPVAELQAERQRVEAVFSGWDHWRIRTFQRGDFTCIMCYAGADPFANPEDGYVCALFAYDEKTGRVRYSYSEEIHEIIRQGFMPHCLTLPW